MGLLSIGILYMPVLVTQILRPDVIFPEAWSMGYVTQIWLDGRKALTQEMTSVVVIFQCIWVIQRALKIWSVSKKDGSDYRFDSSVSSSCPS